MSLSYNIKHRCTPSQFLHSTGHIEDERRAAEGQTCRLCRYDFQEGLWDSDGNVYKYLRLGNETMDRWFDMADRYRENRHLSILDVNLIIDELVITNQPLLDSYRRADLIYSSKDHFDENDGVIDEVSVIDIEDDEEEEDRVYWSSSLSSVTKKRELGRGRGRSGNGIIVVDIRNMEYRLLERRLKRLSQLQTIYKHDTKNEERKRCVAELLRLLPVVTKLDRSTKSRLLSDEYIELESILANHKIIDFIFSEPNPNSVERWIKIPLSANNPILFIDDTRLDNLFYSADYFNIHGYLEMEMAVNIFIQTTCRVSQCVALSKIKTFARETSHCRVMPLKACLFQQLIDVNLNYEDLDTNPSRLHSESLRYLWRSIKPCEFMLDLKQIIIMLNDVVCNERCVRDLAIIVFDKIADVSRIDGISIEIIRQIFRRLCSSDFSLFYLTFPFSFYIDRKVLIDSCKYIIARLIDAKYMIMTTFFRIIDTINVMLALRCTPFPFLLNEANFSNAKMPKITKLNDVAHPFAKDYENLHKPVIEMCITSLTNQRFDIRSNYFNTSSIRDVEKLFKFKNNDRCKIFTNRTKNDKDEESKNFSPLNERERLLITRESILQILLNRYEFARRACQSVTNEICRNETLKPWITERECNNATVLLSRMELRNSQHSERIAYSRRILLNVWATDGVRLKFANSREYVALIKSLILRCKTL